MGIEIISLQTYEVGGRWGNEEACCGCNFSHKMKFEIKVALIVLKTFLMTLLNIRGIDSSKL